MRLAEDQVALVTGAASGIGFELASQFLGRGMTVVMVDVERPALEQARRRLAAQAPTGTLEAFAADVSVGREVIDLAGATIERFGRVDVLCNNAGVVGPRLPVWEQSESDYAWVLGVNLGGVINGLRAFLPEMVARNHGHVLNTASVAALTTIAGGGNGPYAASKHAVLGLSEVLREELAHAAPNVGVSVLCPGPVATRIRDAARNRPLTAGAEPISAPPRFEHRAQTIGAERAAQIAIEGIESDRFLLLTNAGNRQEVNDHMTRRWRELDTAPQIA
jgi:NAD(P)-dependent dehydrogenase (short-subunit alcohol dehydrogenase family)